MNKPFQLTEDDAALRSDVAKGSAVRRPSSVPVSALPMLRPPVFNRREALYSSHTPTHRECRPHRPRPSPRWSPSRSHNAATTSRATPGFPPQRVLLEAAPDLGQTRINFSYDNHGSTSADFCDKPGRQQFCEGPHESAWRRWATVNVNCTDFQFQPIKATFIDAAGNATVAFWDVGFEFYDGTLAFAEIKADATFFEMAKTRLATEASAEALAQFDAVFLRLHGSDFDPITLQTIKYVFDRRRTIYDPDREAVPVIESIRSAAGEISLARALEIIGGGKAGAEAKLCAMMVDRRVALCLARPLTGSTPVRLAPPAVETGALRRFLSQLVSEEV